MNTMFLLMAEYETASILLPMYAKKYFGMKQATADKKSCPRAIANPNIPGWRKPEGSRDDSYSGSRRLH